MSADIPSNTRAQRAGRKSTSLLIVRETLPPLLFVSLKKPVRFRLTPVQQLGEYYQLYSGSGRIWTCHRLFRKFRSFSNNHTLVPSLP